MDKVLNTRAEVSSSSPNILDESDFFGVDFELFGQPSIVELNAFVLEEDEFVGFIEDLDSNHDET
jgi:hypothetical protein